jgi:hypothetical protein
MHRSFLYVLVGAAFFALGVPAANAESFPALGKQGYVVGPMGQGKSGGLGWVVSKGGSKFFCRLKASMAYSGRNDMVSFTTSGRMIKLNRAVFESSIGGHDSTIPQLSDLKAGRVKPADVGSCSKI